jgi:hypothetical protein
MNAITTAIKVQRRSRLDHSSKRSFPADSVNDMKDLDDIADRFLLTMPDCEGEERRRLNRICYFYIDRF